MNIEAENLTDAEFRKRIAKRARISNESVTKVIRAMTNIIIETVSDGGSITIRGLGVFKAYMRPAQDLKNLIHATEESMEPYRAMKFSPALRTKKKIRLGYRIREDFDV